MTTNLNKPVFVVLTAAGLDLAKRLRDAVPGVEIHGLAKRVDGADVGFDHTIEHLQALFQADRPIVGVCAAGILIRALAPVLADKRVEPAVVALSEDGASAVPLLGGHHGANRLAASLAEATGGNAALTTAGDVVYGLALDDPPAGWRIANPEAAKRVSASLLAGEPVSLSIEAGDAGWLTESGAPFGDGERSVRVTDKAAADGDELVLHPPILTLGVGCERDAEPSELIELAETTLRDAGLSARAVACVVSIDVKADEAAVHALATHLEVPARFFTAEELEAEAPRLANPSHIVFAEVGCHGVAEGAALAAAGPDGELCVEKRKSARATCAIARATRNLDAAGIGAARGRLTIVGVGPGAEAWRTPAVTRVLSQATDVVGYGLYLDLIADVITGAERHQSDLAQEEARVRRALEIAAEGREVALVCSGDAGIYALATLAFELLDREDRSEWNRLEIAVEPGVSAIQAAAARAGAPIGHDFCTVSLSDLLTPWPEIERRLRGAAEGDFVVALYNPVSKRRRDQLPRAREILLTGRPASTPVILARNLGRDGEQITVVTLGELTPDHADMLTLVLIGSSQTRVIERGGRLWVYTPRGYETKLAPVRTA